MFSDSFLTDNHSQRHDKRPKSPPRSYEDWTLLEDIDQWPCTSPHEAPSGLNPDNVVGSLDDIKEDLRTHSPWGAVFLDSIEKRLQKLENTLSGLADKFTYGPAAPESVAGGLANIKDMTFLTELRDANLLTSARPGTSVTSYSDHDGRTIDSLVYPGIRVGSSTVPLPGTLEPLQLLNLVTKTTSLPPYITKSWRKVFFSDDSCSLLENTFWYVWLSYFKPKPEPEDLSRLFGVISENFTSLIYILEHKHKDEVFIYLPGCLARAVYSAFCHGFPKSNKIFNSESFLSYVTNLTSEWITGVVCPPNSWKKWPFHFLNPHYCETAKGVAESDTPVTRTAALSEKDVMRLSIKDKPRAVRLRTHTVASGKRSRGPRTAHSRSKNTTHSAEDEGVGVGKGPTFECVWFSLTARSPLLQHYLVTHGLVEDKEGVVEGVVGPVVGRTQISELPPPTVSYNEVLKSSKAAAKRNYDAFERELAKKEQEIMAARKKHNALLRASDRRTERLLQHRYQVAIMAERIMNNYACKSAPLKPTQTQSSTS